MNGSSYKHFTNLEGSFPNKTPANPTLCSRWPATPTTLLHDPASRTITFTVLAPYKAAPQKQVCSQLHINSPPLYQPAHHRHTSPSAPNNTCTTHRSPQTSTIHASVHPLRYTRPGKHTIHIPAQHHDTPICTPLSHIHTRSHLGLLRNSTQRRHKS